MYITSCTMTRCFLSDPGSPGMNVVFGSSGSLGSLSQRNATETLDGDFRVYAGGRIRLVTRTAVTKTVPIVLRALTPQQAVQVKAWRGRLLLLRDAYGLRNYGSYLETQELDLPRTSQGTLKDILVNFQALTYSDAV